MTKFSFREVAPCLFAIFIDILSFGLVAPLLITFFTSPENNIFSISSPYLRYLSLGITLALHPLLMFFGSSFIGDLSDIIGRKKTLLISMGGLTLGFILMAVGIASASFSLFLLGRGVCGLVAASQSVALATISDLSTSENKAIHLSYVALVQCIGFVVGPLLGGVLSIRAFYAPFLWAAFFGLVAFVWVAVSFQETFIKKCLKKFSFKRIFRVFIEAYQNKRIRDLSVAFLIMQMGVGLYIPIILVLLATDFGYPPLYLGLFNGYVGIAFALALLLVLPRLLKRYKIEQIVYMALFTTFAAQFLTSILRSKVAVWVLAFPLAMALELAFSGMFTAYSNSADETSQGWAMGISTAVMAISWALAGMIMQLVPIVGVHAVLLVGSIFIGLSAVLMRKYSLKHL